MSDGNSELFDSTPGELAHLLENQPELVALVDRWPKTLVDLVDVLCAFFRDKGREEAEAQSEAQAVVIALAHYFGGREIYLPRDTRLQLALRDGQIWHEFDGHNAEDLAERHGLTARQVYTILADQRHLHRQKTQLPLL